MMNLRRNGLLIAKRYMGTTSMRQVVLPKPGDAMALKPEVVEMTDNVDGSNVRIKVSACAVAYRDIIDRNGGFPFMNQVSELHCLRILQNCINRIEIGRM